MLLTLLVGDQRYNGAGVSIIEHCMEGVVLPEAFLLKILFTALTIGAGYKGVTNCPLTALLISFEMFGYQGMPYFLLAVAFSNMLSGYFGLYHSQKIIYSKYRMNYINRKAE